MRHCSGNVAAWRAVIFAPAGHGTSVWRRAKVNCKINLSQPILRHGTMKHLICLAVLLVVTASIPIAHAEQQEVRSCKFEVKARCASGEARVTIAGGVVTRVEVDVHWCGLRGRPGYTCTIDSSRSDQESTWSDDAGATLIANASPFNPAQLDRVKVTVGRHVSIDLDEA